MKYLILGANAAGLSAAVRILKFDKQAKVTVIEKTDVVSFGACGIPYYIGGEFDNIEQMTARPYQAFIESGIDIQLLHSAIAVHPEQKIVKVLDIKNNKISDHEYDRLLISTGASPIKPAIQGCDLTYVHTMHSKADAITLLNTLPKVQNVVIIGAGFIGLEAAEAFTTRNKNVTIIEFSDRVLAKTFDPEITPILQASLQKHGVQLQLNEEVVEITGENGLLKSVITNKGEYPADLVILATGFKPNTEFLSNSGLIFSKEGAILINDQCQTNITDIYAAGDCATVPHKIKGDVYIPLATSANKLGRIAGEVMTGKNCRFIATLGSSGIRVFDHEAGRTGISEADAIAQTIEYSTVFIKDKNHSDYVPEQTDMWVKLIYNKISRKLLGGQICGSYLGGAVHRVDALAVAIHSGLTVDELGMLDFIYAPPFSRTWEILNVAGNVAK